MTKSESIKNLAVALTKVQSKLQNAKNTADNPFYKSKYAPLGEVLDLIRPVLAEHGLSVIQYPSSDDGKTISIHTMLVHESGEYIDFDPLTLTAEKITPQGAGAAITYGRRYSVSGIFNIASEDDDDGNLLEGSKPETTSKKFKKDTMKAIPIPINQSEAMVLEGLIKKTGTDKEKFLAYYKVDKPEQLNKEMYEHALAVLKKKNTTT
jgi:hypothetical protein